MSASEKNGPSLTPSFPLASKQTGRVMTNAEALEPHRGWYSRGYLPHWDHPGLIQSINFRLADSLPTEVIAKWKDQLDSGRRDAGAPRNDAELRRRIEDYLDAGHGECLLRRDNV